MFVSVVCATTSIFPISPMVSTAQFCTVRAVSGMHMPHHSRADYSFKAKALSSSTPKGIRLM